MDYYIVIGLSVIIIFSHFFNVIANRTNVPSVILLLALGLLIKTAVDFFGYSDRLDVIYKFEVLPVIGTMGLILIVLEAALDLKLTKDRWPVIWRSFMVALLSLIATTTAIALILEYFLHRPIQCISICIAIIDHEQCHRYSKCPSIEQRQKRIHDL